MIVIHFNNYRYMKNLFVLKNYFFAVIFAIVLGFSSCSYDDDDLWNSVNDLENQIKNDLNVTIEKEGETFIYGESKEFAITFTGVESFTISKPDGWKASINDNKLLVEAPNKDNPYSEATGKVTIIAIGKNNTSYIANLEVSAEYKRTLVTFEDDDTSAYWSLLIDSPQYGGDLLYGKGAATYSWLDSESNLYSSLNEVYGVAFWSGGIAVSNYASEDFTANGGFTQQLTVYGTGGNNGSKNFAVSFGYYDNSGYTSPAWQPRMKFNDGVAKTIEYMYIAPTTYFFNVATNGNGLSAPVGQDDVWITATGYLNEVEGNTVTTYMIKKGEFLISKWTKWELLELGKVDKVVFNIGGGTDNGYGFSLPAYFAIDDIMIIHN